MADNTAPPPRTAFSLSYASSPCHYTVFHSQREQIWSWDLLSFISKGPGTYSPNPKYMGPGTTLVLNQWNLGSTQLSPVVRDWVIKDLDMSSRVCVTGHIKDPVPLIEKSRAFCPGGRFPPSFIHQGSIITGLNKLYDCMFST